MEPPYVPPPFPLYELIVARKSLSWRCSVVKMSFGELLIQIWTL